MPAKPSLLFVSPTRPARGGNGLAMRMGIFLEAYARRFQVTLVVVPLAGQTSNETLTPFVLRHTRRVIELPLDRVMHPLIQLIARHRDPEARRVAMRAYPRPRPLYYDPIATRELLADQLGEERFALVHAGRIYVAPLVDPYLGKTRCILDLDEDDARSLLRIGRLLAANGDVGAADYDGDAAKFDALMGEYLPRFDRCLVAAEAEAACLRARYPGAALGVIANAIRPRELLNDASTGCPPLDPIDLLMVGTLGYYPNADGAAFLCRDIVPLLGRNGQWPRIAIVGSKPPESVRALGALPEVSVFADVPDVAPYYAAAKVAVVPLRAGGGSRIKILEAFAHGRPVVSTRIGAEGLAVADGRHLLLADTAEAFAAAVRRLLSDPDLAARLAAEARQLVDERYDFECVAREIEALADPAAGVIECGRG